MPVSVETLYRSLSTASLEDLQRAFWLDRSGAIGDPEALAFIDGRLRLIAHELKSQIGRAHV